MTPNPTDSSLRHESSDAPSTATPVDVRRFPWIRRLAADYAFNFPVVAVVGENGSGKSTLMKVAACVYDNKEKEKSKMSHGYKLKS